MKALELLAPAKNLYTGIAAINSGADAVYIGAARFGARAAAGNSLEDIAQLCQYAHSYRARVYVTVNTLMHDDELPQAVETLEQLYHIGVDAVLIQDMRLLLRSLPPIEIHASTQCDIRSADDVMRFYRCGIRRVVLARELTLQQIETICQSVPNDMEIECFVHGAICVCYSGRCYASEYCFNRSANRGECAQFCRLPFTLSDEEGHVIGPEAHYLSLKDMRRLDDIGELAAAGVCSFKIEGRLKDEVYVKNVVAAYDAQLNHIINEHPTEYCRQAIGGRTYEFTPDVARSFNRGFSDYFLHQPRTSEMWSPYTPKAIGKKIGTVKRMDNSWIELSTATDIANGDGLCFINNNHKLTGFRVNRVEGAKLFPFKYPENLRQGDILYRSQDTAFEKQLLQANGKRRIPVSLNISPDTDGYHLCATVMYPYPTPLHADIHYTFTHQQAQKPQHDNIVRQLSKWGNTLFTCINVDIDNAMRCHFIPSSVLSDMRRQLSQTLTAHITQQHPRTSTQFCGTERHHEQLSAIEEAIAHMPVLYNHHTTDIPLMQCRFCLRHALGGCKQHPAPATSSQMLPVTIPAGSQPLRLTMSNGKAFCVTFDCKHCQMNIHAHQ